MKWKNLAIRTIKKDCMACGEYLTEEGHTCAIAALAIAAGCPPPKNIEHSMNKCGVAEASEGWLLKATRAIKRKFGLDSDQQEEIQKANDGVYGGTEEAPARRRAVLAVIKSF